MLLVDELVKLLLCEFYCDDLRLIGVILFPKLSGGGSRRGCFILIKGAYECFTFLVNMNESFLAELNEEFSNLVLSLFELLNLFLQVSNHAFGCGCCLAV